MAGLPTVEAQETGRCRLVWWPNCYLLLRCSRGIVVLLLRLELLLLLGLWAITLVLLWGSMRLSCGWGIDHEVV
jgi:hypothetical protein